MARAEKVVPTPEFEAEALYAVTMRIAGSPTLSRRRHMDAIRTALVAVDVQSETYDLSREKSGINFEDSNA